MSYSIHIFRKDAYPYIERSYNARKERLEMKDHSLKNRISSLSDSELRSIIYTVYTAAGMDKAKADALVSDMGAVRKTLSEADESQISQMLLSFKGKDMGTVLKNLSRNAGH